MSAEAPLRRRFWAVLAAALVLGAGPLAAAPVEVPRLDAPAGSAGADAAPGASVGSLLAPTLSAPGLSAAPLPALPPSALPSATPATPAAPAAAASPAAVAPSPAALPAARPGVFGRRASPPAESVPTGGTEGDWARSAVLFDLSAAPGAEAPIAVPAELPQTPVGKVLARLRRAGATGLAGPGRIPGMAAVEWGGGAGRGHSGETAKLRIGGQPWYLKKLGPSPDPVIDATPPETRARNEAGLAAALREDPLLSKSFSVSPEVGVFRDGPDVFVLTRGLPSVGDGESRRQELSPVQRADAAIIQLVLGLGDMHGGDVLPLGGGRFGLIDFEKLSRAPLQKETLHEIDNQVMLKNFPLVDRLSVNDPAVYRARFAAWKTDYDAGGRARLDRALDGAGWTRPQREAYLAAVDRNAETFLDRLQPYLDYANGWHKRVQEARAEAARRQAAPKKGFFDALLGRR
jgi:hypothetical protein